VTFYPSQEHSAALQYYLEIVAPCFAYNRSTFFTIDLLLMVSQNTEVMQTVIAIATLNASKQGRSTARWTDQSPLFHYNSAISAFTRRRPARHVALIVSLMLWLYEQIDNQHMRALFHRASAVKMLDEWRNKEFGIDPPMDRYIQSTLEPILELGFKMTAPVKLCREVLQVLQEECSDDIIFLDACTYDEAQERLRSCIYLFADPCEGEEETGSNRAKGRIALLSLHSWSYQFEHYSGCDWVEEGPILLCYAVVVAMLVQKRSLEQSDEDPDWQRASDFLLEEASRLRFEEDSLDHAPLLTGLAALVGDK
jgi:hypothetical protein